MREGFDPYDVLGVSPEDDAETIRRQWRRLMQQAHPDRSDRPDAADYFHEVETAGRILLDAERRAHWDAHGIDAGEQGTLREQAQVWIFNAMRDAVQRAVTGHPLLRSLLNAALRERRELVQQVEQLQKLHDAMPDVMPVWQGSPEEDPQLFATALANGQAQVQQLIRQTDQKIEMLNLVEQLLERHEDNPNRPRPQHMPTGFGHAFTTPSSSTT